jgi:hypothetical protein
MHQLWMKERDENFQCFRQHTGTSSVPLYPVAASFGQLALHRTIDGPFRLLLHLQQPGSPIDPANMSEWDV